MVRRRLNRRKRFLKYDSLCLEESMGRWKVKRIIRKGCFEEDDGKAISRIRAEVWNTVEISYVDL